MFIVFICIYLTCLSSAATATAVHEGFYFEGQNVFGAAPTRYTILI